MKILEARLKIVEKLAGKGLVEKVDEKYQHNVQLCYKCSNLIEPQIVPQWYVNMTKNLPDGRPSLRDMALRALDKKEVEIVTERFEKIFRHWMENIRDWPISRQIWWGIPIPVKYCQDCGETIICVDDNILKKEEIKVCPKCGKGKLAGKRTKKGKIFYGCNRFPECDFALWDKPTGEKCEKCGSLLVQKGKQIKCSNKDCDYKVESKAKI